MQASKTVRERDVRDNKDKQKDEAITADNGRLPVCTHSDTICAAACTRATLQVTITGGKPFSSHAPEFSAKALIGSFLISIAYRSNFLLRKSLCANLIYSRGSGELQPGHVCVAVFFRIEGGVLFCIYSYVYMQ